MAEELGYTDLDYVMGISMTLLDDGKGLGVVLRVEACEKFQQQDLVLLWWAEVQMYEWL